MGKKKCEMAGPLFPGPGWLLVWAMCFALRIWALTYNDLPSGMPEALKAQFATPEKDPFGIEFENAQPRNRYHKQQLDRHGHADLYFLARDWVRDYHTHCQQELCPKFHQHLHTALDRDGNGELTPRELYSLALGLGYELGDHPREQHARIGHAYRTIKAGRPLREHFNQPPEKRKGSSATEHLASLNLEDMREWIENKLHLSNKWKSADHRPEPLLAKLVDFWEQVQGASYQLHAGVHRVEGHRYDL